MALSELPISYCANVHPAHDFSELLANLERYTKPLARSLSRPMAVGLWLPDSVVSDVADNPARAEELAGWLGENNLTCYTMNAFPFGDFHAASVKQNVYLPDWSSARRLDFTGRVADLLARLLPAGMEGSISTVPLAFKALHPEGAGWARYFDRLLKMAKHLADLERKTGKTIRLAIEPEPLCVLETTDEAIGFFREFRQTLGSEEDRRIVRRHIGLCYDVCHQAVEFEDVAESIRKLDENEITIAKVHVTCALQLDDPTDLEARRQLARFAEPRYLHQTFARQPGMDTPMSRTDLSAEWALDPEAEWLRSAPWRIHFHVPVDETALGKLTTTRPSLEDALRAVAKLDQTPHLEVETYTWNVLPKSEDNAAFELVDGLRDELESTFALLDEIGKTP